MRKDLNWLFSAVVCVIMVFLVMPFTAKAAGWESEDNDSKSVADVISVNSAVAGCLSVNNDVDYYKFTTEKNGYIVLEFGKEFDSEEKHYWNVTLMDSAETTIKSEKYYAGNEETESFCAIGLPAGTYYVKVDHGTYSSYRSDAVYYLNISFKSSSVWETEFNNSKSTADPISVNKKYYGTMKTDSDEDYYKFTLSKDGKVTLKFGKKFDSEEKRYWNITLMDSKGTTIKTEQFHAGSEDTEVFCPIGLPKGTYYVKVDHGTYSSYRSEAVYSLYLGYAASSVWESEFNDSVSTADSISANKTYYGTMSKSGDEDYYKVKITTAARISIRFCEDFKDTEEKHYWNVTLMNSDRKTLQTMKYYCGTGAAKTSAVLSLSAGTYYVKVDHGSYSSYRSEDVYNLKVNAKFTSTKSKVTALTNLSDGIKVEWNKVSEAAGYKIYRKEGNGNYTLITTISSKNTLSYKDTDVKSKNLSTYTYLVKAYKGNLLSVSYSSKTICRLVKMAAPGVTNQSGLKMKVTWTNNSKYSGYQIKYVTGSTTKTVKVSGGSKTSKTISGLKKGAAYKVYIRSYKTTGGTTYYSAWSSAKSVTIKK